MKRCPPLSLVRLAPEPQDGWALELAGHLADLLNEDDGLAEFVGRRADSPRQTAESVLSFARDWCRDHNAEFFAIVLDDRAAIGAISLSRIDLAACTARAGYWLGSAHWQQGHGGEAFRQLLTICSSRGIRQLRGHVDENNIASRRIWNRCGAEIRWEGAEATLFLP